MTQTRLSVHDIRRQLVSRSVNFKMDLPLINNHSISPSLQAPTNLWPRDIINIESGIDYTDVQCS